MKITNIRKLLPLVEQKPEFKVLDKGEYLVIDYVYQDQNTFDIPELMECRGIKFDSNGLILARPFRKFFNYGEKGSGLPIHRPHTITTKLDGSMIHPAKLDRRMFMMTRKGHTDVAKQAERFIVSSPDHGYLPFCEAALRDGWTPIFEYVGPDNRIVLRYEEPKLVLLAMRHTIEGTVMPFIDMLASADEYNIPIVTPPDIPLLGDPLINVDWFVKHTRELEDAEGYVVYFDDGYMVKIKADDYVMKHRALDNMDSKKKVVALCAQGFHDDVLPMLSEADAAELLTFNDELQLEITRLSGTATALAQRVVRGDITRKVFAQDVMPTIVPRFIAGLAFGVMDGKDARALAIDAVIKNVDFVEAKWRRQ